ncbi:toll/interleukin-1 receptor domain-containing protein, partial [Paracoccus fistulariae]
MNLATTAAQWPTPLATDGAKPSAGSRKSADLTHAAGMWMTPTARDHKDGATTLANTPVNGLLGRQVLTTPRAGSDTSDQRRTLNPLFVEALMGWPTGWTGSASVAMAWSPWLRRMRSELWRISCWRAGEMVGQMADVSPLPILADCGYARRMAENRDYDIALSFAGEERDYVDRVANLLKERGIKVFYDLFEEADLWGKDLYVHLSEVYHRRAQFTVMFISRAYADKLWTNHERKSAQARAFQEAQEYILPARFDDTEIPGVLPTVGYISLRNRSPEDFVSLVTKKLVSSGGSVPTELVRRDFSTLARAEASAGSKLSISVRDDEGTPIKGCNLTVQANNGTSIAAKTGDDGLAVFELKVRSDLPLNFHPAATGARLVFTPIGA